MSRTPTYPELPESNESITERIKKALAEKSYYHLTMDMVMRIKLCGTYQFTEEETAYHIWVNIMTLRKWFKEVPEVKVAFLDARSDLMGHAKMIIHSEIVEKKDWKTAKWLLENKASDQYAKRQINDTTAPPIPEGDLTE